MAKKAVVVLDVRTSRYQQKMAQANKSMTNLKKSVFNLKNAFLAAFAGAVATKVISFLKDAIALSKIQEEASAGLAQAMLQQGKFTNRAFREMKEYAGALQLATNVGDEEIIGIQKRLVQFGLFGDELNRVTELVLDMEKSNIRSRTAIMGLGQAVTGNFSSLASLNNTIRASIKEGATFADVLDILETQFGGQARALAALDINKLDGMVKQWGDFKENVGKGAAEALAQIADELFRGAEGMAEFNASSGDFISEKTKDTLVGMADAAILLADAIKTMGEHMKFAADILTLGFFDDLTAIFKDVKRLGGDIAEAGSNIVSKHVAPIFGDHPVGNVLGARRNKRLEREFEKAMENMTKTIENQNDRIKRQSDMAGVGG